MKALHRYIAFSLIFFSTLLVLPRPATSVTSALAGTYKITENTDLGSEVRITVQITLFNSSTTSLTVTRVGLHSISARGQLVNASSSLVVQSHSHSQVSLQFLIAKRDFTQWQRGPHQQFLVTYKPSGGKSTLVNVPLLRTQG